MCINAKKRCKFFSQACSIAIIIDYLSPRPGLIYHGSVRNDIPGIAFLLASTIAKDVCMKSCLLGTEIASYPARKSPTKYWFKGLKELRHYGNPSMGSLLLLTFQAASLGYALSHKGDDTIHSVMGSTEAIIEEAGVQGTVDFYKGLRLVKPSYLFRIAWGGLPDATNNLFSRELLEKKITIKELACSAGIYDQVLADICRRMELSLGYTYNTIMYFLMNRGAKLEEAVREATLGLVEWLGDFLLARKGSPSLAKAYGSFIRNKAHQISVKGLRIGPGATADIVVNAVARIVYESLSKRSILPL